MEENGNEEKEIVKREEEASPKVFGVLRKRTGDGGRGGQNNGRSVYYSSPSGYMFLRRRILEGCDVWILGRKLQGSEPVKPYRAW